MFITVSYLDLRILPGLIFISYNLSTDLPIHNSGDVLTRSSFFSCPHIEHIEVRLKRMSWSRDFIFDKIRDE